ncbi:LytR C-terminal domain-containing protein [Amnibacterium endophyticum]|uniref:LytR C-terminal domain-containing protein n=1 Tax=Amnibacterium endophyticum TaxID=2109337 RepID=A0ABW4LDZ2_9MICO
MPITIGAGSRAGRSPAAASAARPRDRFDDVPADLARVGAHRAPVRRRGLATFGWAALATGALVAVGVLGLGFIEGRVGAAETPLNPVSAAAAGPAATVDPGAKVAVLNATTTTGLAASASRVLQGDRWNVVSTANADVQDRTTSTVYYAEADQLGAAKGLAKSLGIERTAKTDRFGAPGSQRLTVVLGSDWSPKG